jgi:hypothetical protein
MDDLFVQEKHLRDIPALRRVSAKDTKKYQVQPNMQRSGECFHIHLSLHQLVKGLFISWMPYLHAKVLDKEGHNVLIAAAEVQLRGRTALYKQIMSTSIIEIMQIILRMQNNMYICEDDQVIYITQNNMYNQQNAKRWKYLK